MRKNLIHFRPHKPTHYLIVSGDQLYRMDLGEMFRKHLESGCRLTIAGTLVSRDAASSLGIIKIKADGSIDSFMEKPGPTKDINDFSVPEGLKPGDADPQKPISCQHGHLHLRRTTH